MQPKEPGDNPGATSAAHIKEHIQSTGQVVVLLAPT